MIKIFRDDLLKGKIVLISGGRTGIGLGIVNAYLKYGATIIILGRKYEQLYAKFSKSKYYLKKLYIFQCDVKNYSEIKAVTAAVIKRFKRIDVLINNAGLNYKIQSELLRENMLEYSIKTNLIGPFFLTIQVARQMIKQKGIKKIFNISAFAGSKAYPSLAHSHAGKAGLDALTRTLSIEWSRFNILVNAISPGQVLTENFLHVLTYRDVAKGKNVKQLVRDYLEKELPLGKYISIDDVANMAVYLASRAGDNITGQVIAIDGGVCVNNSYLLNQLKES